MTASGRGRDGSGDGDCLDAIEENGGKGVARIGAGDCMVRICGNVSRPDGGSVSVVKTPLTG